MSPHTWLGPLGRGPQEPPLHDLARRFPPPLFEGDLERVADRLRHHERAEQHKGQHYQALAVCIFDTLRDGSLCSINE